MTFRRILAPNNLHHVLSSTKQSPSPLSPELELRLFKSWCSPSLSLPASHSFYLLIKHTFSYTKPSPQLGLAVERADACGISEGTSVPVGESWETHRAAITLMSKDFLSGREDKGVMSLSYRGKQHIQTFPVFVSFRGYESSGVKKTFLLSPRRVRRAFQCSGCYSGVLRLHFTLLSEKGEAPLLEKG